MRAASGKIGAGTSRGPIATPRVALLQAARTICLGRAGRTAVGGCSASGGPVFLVGHQLGAIRTAPGDRTAVCLADRDPGIYVSVHPVQLVAS